MSDELPEATELEWLKWFCVNADFGPADDDVRQWMYERFEEKTGKRVPANWRSE